MLSVVLNGVRMCWMKEGQDGMWRTVADEHDHTMHVIMVNDLVVGDCTDVEVVLSDWIQERTFLVLAARARSTPRPIRATAVAGAGPTCAVAAPIG